MPKPIFLNHVTLGFLNLLLSVTFTFAQTPDFETPDILILGDSQITFGSGPSFLAFFENLEQNCAKTRRDRRKLSKLDTSKVAVIGVRSTSLGTWAKRSKTGKSAICDVDPKWQVNAGSYGTVNRTENAFVQIGRGRNYQFCQSGISAFEAMLRQDYYDPKLLIMSFLGNSSKTWAKDPAAALRDVKSAMAQLPKGMPCVFMTTAPTYQKKVVDMRFRAQQNLQRAFAQTSNRCSFVAGFTPATIKNNLGVNGHFSRHPSGAVKDPFHPNKVSARKFFDLQRDAICQAVLEQLK